MILVLLALGCAATQPGPETWRLDGAVAESSGLAASARHPGTFWTHGDSGTGNWLFAVDGQGRVEARVQVKGAELVDWEDLTPDGDGNLWLADSGNNDNDRRDLAMYRVPEPDPDTAREARIDRAVRFSYPDQAAFPGDGPLNFDAEAVFWSEGRLYLLTKHRSDHDTTLYRFPADEGVVVLERVSSFTVGGPDDRSGGKVTAASLSPDGQTLALLTYHAVLLFGRPASGDDWLSRPLSQFPLVQTTTRQCEAVAWDGPALIVGNEEGRLFRVADPTRRATPFP
ncbi:MAG TPA: hypothetical protein PKA64_26725 [Myxococcota bacterium]|nr:hypothetical protein [Myxococcota bacterium]